MQTNNEAKPLTFLCCIYDNAGVYNPEPYGIGDAMAIDGQMLTAEQQMQLMQQQQAAMDAAAAAGHC
jgi:hypothetical protein